MYKLNHLGVRVTNIETGEIMLVTDQRYVDWVAAGNTPVAVQPTQAEQFKSIERAIEKHMDSVAQSDNWDNRWTCVARAGYTNPWQAKGIKFGQWMDSCWSIAIQAQADVVAGTRTMPTPEQAVSELTAMVW